MDYIEIGLGMEHNQYPTHTHMNNVFLKNSPKILLQTTSNYEIETTNR